MQYIHRSNSGRRIAFCVFILSLFLYVFQAHPYLNLIFKENFLPLVLITSMYCGFLSSKGVEIVDQLFHGMNSICFCWRCTKYIPSTSLLRRNSDVAMRLLNVIAQHEHVMLLTYLIASNKRLGIYFLPEAIHLACIPGWHLYRAGTYKNLDNPD